MTTKQRAAFYYEFSKLLAAGLHADRSAELLLEQKPAAPVRKFLKGLLRGLNDRLGVTEAITRHNAKTVTSLETSLLAAGERGGRLESACEHLARYFELRQQSTDKAIAALIYPLILLHVGLILPDLIPVITGTPLTQALPALIERLLLVWILLLLLASAWTYGSRLAATSKFFNHLINAIPLVGSITRHWALARFSQVFQTGLLAALNIKETLKLAGSASQSALLNTAAQCAIQHVAKGKTLAASLKNTGAFPRSFLNAVDTAEKAGTIDIEMGRWSTIESELAATAQNRAAEWLPRIFYVIIVLYIASRIIALFQGIYGESGFYNQLLNGM